VGGGGVGERVESKAEPEPEPEPGVSACLPPPHTQHSSIEEKFVVSYAPHHFGEYSPHSKPKLSPYSFVSTHSAASVVVVGSTVEVDVAVYSVAVYFDSAYPRIRTISTGLLYFSIVNVIARCGRYDDLPVCRWSRSRYSVLLILFTNR